MTTFAETLRRNFEALGRGDVDGILATWSATGRYDNPMVGAPAVGKDAVRARITLFADDLVEHRERIVVDRVTAAERHAVVEWHIEPTDANVRGVHVVEFDEAGLIAAMVVYTARAV